jgi:hypothetical protein
MVKDLKEEIKIRAGQVLTGAILVAWTCTMLAGLVLGAFSED